MSKLIFTNNISVDFPIYSYTGSRSFKKTVVNLATGGALASDAKDKPVVRALSDVSLRFKEGDRVGLIGHNGSGKTTLLQVLAGIFEPTSGSLRVNGKVTSMLGITLGMDLEASGLDNIYLRGALLGSKKKDIRRREEDIIEFSGLGDFIHLPVKTYSSGMAMRLAFSIATSNYADILLMDEWLSVGDREFVEKANRRMDEIVNNASIVVVASHNEKMIEDRCNVVVRLEHGKVIDYVSN